MNHLRTPLLVAFASLALAGAALAATPDHHPVVSDDEDAAIHPTFWAAYGSSTQFGIGGGIYVPLPKLYPHVGLVAGFTYHFANADNLNITTSDESGTTTSKSDGTYWQIHADLIRDFKLERSSVRPYLGVGIAYGHATAKLTTVTTSTGEPTSTDVITASAGNAILDLVGGATFGKSKTRPFLQATLQVENGSQLLISGGIRF
jgi:hypothetical protein